MARSTSKARQKADGEVAISDYRHAGVSRKNNPPASIAAEGWTPCRALVAQMKAFGERSVGRHVPLGDLILEGREELEDRA